MISRAALCLYNALQHIYAQYGWQFTLAYKSFLLGLTVCMHTLDYSNLV